MSTNYPTGAEWHPLAPWNRVEMFGHDERHTCPGCDMMTVPHFGDLCPVCAAIDAGSCYKCLTEPIMHKDADMCASCCADAAEYRLSTH